jgi:hypothetical protein
MNKTLHMRVLCDGKKNQRKGCIQILESIYSNIYKFPNFTTKEYLHTKVHQMQTNIHKEKGTQNLLSIYQNLQFPKFTTKNVHASQIDQSRRMSSKERETSDKCMGKKFQEWVLIQKFHNCSSDV